MRADASQHSFNQPSSYFLIKALLFPELSLFEAEHHIRDSNVNIGSGFEYLSDGIVLLKCQLQMGASQHLFAFPPVIFSLKPYGFQ